MRETKKILGLDLGVGSIGWAYVREQADAGITGEILDMGVRIVPLETTEKDEFAKGGSVSRNADRRLKRGMRRRNQRRKMRRQKLLAAFHALGWIQDREAFLQYLCTLPPVQIWGLRARAAEMPVTDAELAQVLYHLNQKRGPKLSRRDAAAADAEKKKKQEPDYLDMLAAEDARLEASGQTLGQYHYTRLLNDPNYRIREKLVTRKRHLEEFEQILAVQAAARDDRFLQVMSRLRDEILFFVRPLRSQKGSIRICPFEGFPVKDAEGKERFKGPAVAPVSSPLAELCRMYENVNHVRVYDPAGEPVEVPAQVREAWISKLKSGDNLSGAQLLKMGGYSTKGYSVDALTDENGIRGHVTVSRLRKGLEQAGVSAPAFLRLDVQVRERTDRGRVDTATGELRMELDPALERSPLFQLWHLLYSVDDMDAVQPKLVTLLGCTPEQAFQVAKVSFPQGFAGKSVKAMRRILPGLLQGMTYSAACAAAGYRHSDFLTRAELDNRVLQDALTLIPRNSLRNPVVEKILNQLVHLVNEILARPDLGRPDEVRIELARSLKQNAKARQQQNKTMREREKANAQHREALENEGFSSPGRALMEKYKLYMETHGICPYCGEKMELSEYLHGLGDRDHIIPRTRYFDDSLQNLVAAHVKCNRDKGNRTAWDYVHTLGEAAVQQYKARVNDWKKRRVITEQKARYLLTPGPEIPQDFLNRQLKETQYITREARQMLMQVVREVVVTTGSVTDYLRHHWGYDTLLRDVVWEKYRALGRTEEFVQENGNVVRRIQGWSKREDHRHHALDALVVACTRRTYIQQLNTLNAGLDPDTMRTDQISLRERQIREQMPFPYARVRAMLERILVSFKAGKKVATRGKNRIQPQGGTAFVQPGRLVTPRGALSEETVYGKITVPEMKAITLKKLAGMGPEVLSDLYPKAVRYLLRERLKTNGGDWKKALTEPIRIEGQETPVDRLELRGEREEYVVKYKVEALKAKDLQYVVDPKVKALLEARVREYGEKEAFTNLEANPIWFNREKGIAVKTVRLFTGLDTGTVRRLGQREQYVKPGNNHHIAFYRTPEGKIEEMAVSFWDAVERFQLGLPAVIRDITAAWAAWDLAADPAHAQWEKLPPRDWTYVFSLQQNEMVVAGASAEQVQDWIRQDARQELSLRLYRVQKITTGDYFMRHHTETQVSTSATLADDIRLNRTLRFQSIKALCTSNLVKVKIGRTGLVENILEGLST